MKYFDHDVEAYKDDKIVLLRRECGGAAIDAYWTLLEIIYRDETELKPNENPVGFSSVCFFLQVSEEDLKTYIAAMVKYGLLVETEQGGLMSPRAAGNIKGYRDRCGTNYENGCLGGRPRKNPGENGSQKTEKPKQNRTKTEVQPNETDQEPKRIEKEKEKEKEIYPQTPIGLSLPDFDEVNDDGFAAYLKDALDIFNDECESNIFVVDEATICSLRRIFDGGHTPEDLRLVVRDKRDEWEKKPEMARYIRPSTIYGKKFEEYLAAAKRAEKAAKSEEAEYAEYA